MDFAKSLGPISRTTGYAVVGWAAFNADDFADGIAAYKRALDGLERHLAGREWLVGSSITLADVLAGMEQALLYMCFFEKDMQAAYPATARWFERVYNSDVVQKVVG